MNMWFVKLRIAMVAFGLAWGAMDDGDAKYGDRSLSSVVNHPGHFDHMVTHALNAKHEQMSELAENLSHTACRATLAYMRRQGNLHDRVPIRRD